MLAIAALALLLLALGGNGPDPSTGHAGADTPQRGGTLAVGLLDEPVTLNPLIVANGIVDSTITNAINDPLVVVSGDGTPQPVLATRIPTIENGGVTLTPAGGMRVVVDLQPHAAWSDGEPIECDDVRFTWQTINTDRWVIASRRGWDEITGVDCPTPKRAILDFRTVYSDYMEMMRSQVFPRHDLEGDDFNRAWLEDIPVSSGPFVFHEWRHGSAIILRRNERYWNAGPEQLPRLDRIEYRFFADANTLAVELSTGDIDVIGRLMSNPLDMERRTFPRAKVLATPLIQYQGFSFNASRPATKDVRVRQALAYAIDRDELVAAVLGEPYERLDGSLVPQNGEVYAPSFARYRPDAAKVRELLEQAGYEHRDGGWYRGDRKLVLTYKTIADRNLRMKTAQLVQEQLRAHDIEVEVILETPQVFYGTTLRTGSWDLIFWGLGIGLDVVQRGYYHCEPAPGRTNASRWCSEEATRLIDDAARMLPGAERTATVRRLHEIIAEELPVLPVVQDKYETVLTPRVHGYRPSPLGTGIGWDAEHWWVTG